jgi:hypothetical protein
MKNKIIFQNLKHRKLNTLFLELIQYTTLFNIFIAIRSTKIV